MNKVDILGIKVDAIFMDEALGIVEKWLAGKGKHYIVTPNPEFVMAAQKDGDFKKILNNADLAIPDGAGLKLASDLKSIIPGVDFLERLCRLASEKGFTVGFLGGKDGVAKEAAECLQKKYANLKITLVADGPQVDNQGEEINGVDLGIKSFPNLDLLFVGFGQVKQEKWIVKNLPDISVKVAMGVGGAFDYLSGRVPRAPLWMRNLGLEWLFRLINQPWRIKRQLALLKFVWMVALKKSVVD